MLKVERMCWLNEAVSEFAGRCFRGRGVLREYGGAASYVSGSCANDWLGASFLLLPKQV